MVTESGFATCLQSPSWMIVAAPALMSVQPAKRTTCPSVSRISPGTSCDVGMAVVIPSSPQVVWPGAESPHAYDTRPEQSARYASHAGFDASAGRSHWVLQSRESYWWFGAPQYGIA